MINYEIFKEVVVDTFKDYLPEQYRDMKLQVASVNKVNRIMDGINLTGDNSERNLSPTIYINDMYNYYMECNDLKEVLQAAADRMADQLG